MRTMCQECSKKPVHKRNLNCWICNLYALQEAREKIDNYFEEVEE